eukprot:NODE_995_length_2762_cov_0.259106.p3 type:complete len:124 gc:universal NODE_995_length_2762_cov_0.259106:2026-1655(-)
MIDQCVTNVAVANVMKLLVNHKQMILHLGPQYSAPVLTNVGLAQGSVLSALYYIKTTDIALQPISSTHSIFFGQFSDDINILAPRTDIESIKQQVNSSLSILTYLFTLTLTNPEFWVKIMTES